VTLDIAPLYDTTSSQKRSGMARFVSNPGVHTYAFIRERYTNYAFAFPAEAGRHSTDPGKTEA